MNFDFFYFHERFQLLSPTLISRTHQYPVKYLRKLRVFSTAHIFLPRSLVGFQKTPIRTIYFKRPYAQFQ